MTSPTNATGRSRRLVIDAFYLARLHTVLALTAFFAALVLGCLLHYKKIVKNGVAGYPQEWFPSVSATIGDWYPERNVFQILIALNSGPRLAVVLFQYYLHTRATKSILPGVVCAVGILRTLSCGGWVYITSTDDHDAHDVLMIGYIVLNIPWMWGSIACTPVQYTDSLRRRRYMSTAFFASIVPMIYFFIQHKVHRIPGAYTHYSFFEWALIVFDVLFDSAAELDLKSANLKIAVGLSFPDASENETDTIASTTIESSNESEAPVVSQEISKAIPVISQPSIDSSADAKSKTTLAVLYAGLKSPLIDFLSDVYLSYIFWSIFTSLTPTLFYFSVWELGIAGHELALLSSLSPILLGISPFLRWCRSHSGRTTLHVLSLTGLAAYALSSPLQRLFVVSFANSVACIGAAVDWTSQDEHSVQPQGFLLGLGLILSSLAKHANHSNNPVWPIVDEHSGGFNKTGILLAVLAIYNFSTRKTKAENSTSTSKTTETKSQTWTAGASDESSIADSIALGSLIFSLHCLLADSSTLIAWSWTGYPIQGPVPNLHGSLTHVAQVAGLFLPLILTSVSNSAGKEITALSHPLWLAYGSASAFVMYSYKNWLGYLGGLNFAVFLMSVIPLVLARAVPRRKVASTYFTAWFVVCLLDLANVWTVAYAFVPGGVYLRERSDLVLIAQVLGIALAFRSPRSSSSRLHATGSVQKSARTLIGSFLAVLSILSLLVTMYRWPSVVPQPHRPGPRIFRAGIWTVHFGIDNEGRDSQRRMANLIRDMELDIVGLLETDLQRIVFGNRDLTRVMVEELGYYVDIGPGPNSHTWGAVLLSKFPIINSTHHLLPSPDGELAPAIEAVLNIFGTQVTVIVSHNGQEETPLDRELQSKELARIMAKSFPQPVLFLGYVVTKPHAPRPAPYEILLVDGQMKDIDKDDYDRWCEYILYRGLYRTAYARVSRSTITDTELQIGQFQLPRHGYGVTTDNDEALYLRAWKEEMPVEHWFPPEYYLDQGGVRGHYYHVFNTPLYYKLPEGAVL